MRSPSRRSSPHLQSCCCSFIYKHLSVDVSMSPTGEAPAAKPSVSGSHSQWFLSLLWTLSCSGSLSCWLLEPHGRGPAQGLEEQRRAHDCKVTVTCSSSETQFLGRLIRSLGSPRRRKGPGVLEEEIGVWNSQRGGKDKHLFSLYIPQSQSHKRLFFFKPGTDDYTTQFKLCTRDYITTMYPACGQFSPF